MKLQVFLLFFCVLWRAFCLPVRDNQLGGDEEEEKDVEVAVSDEILRQIEETKKLMEQNKEELSKYADKSVSLGSRFDDDFDDNFDPKRSVQAFDDDDEDIIKMVEVDTRSSFQDDPDDIDYEFLRKAFEGDTVYQPKQLKQLFSNETVESEDDDDEPEGYLPSRTGIRHNYYRWPKQNGLVYIPYAFHKGHFSSSEKSLVKRVMRYVTKYTCVHFVPYASHRDYVLIYAGAGCSSNVGRTGNRQLLSLNKQGCIHSAVILHELVHAIGFTHMHNHFDRDNYVKIFWHNINSGDRHNFQKVSSASYFNFNTPYDYKSIMHYSATTFSNSRTKRSMATYDQSFVNKIGYAKGFSVGDVQRIRRMYEC